MNEFIMEFRSIWSELSVGDQIRVGLTILSIPLSTGCMVAMVWKLIPKNRWGYRLVSVPVVITLWLGSLVLLINGGGNLPGHSVWILDCTNMVVECVK
jgi:hypothetical protein